MENAYTKQHAPGSTSTTCTGHCVAILYELPATPSASEASMFDALGHLRPTLCTLVCQCLGVAVDSVRIGEVNHAAMKTGVKPQIVFEFEVDNVTDEVLRHVKGRWKLDHEEIGCLRVVSACGRVHSVIGCVEGVTRPGAFIEQHSDNHISH